MGRIDLSNVVQFIFNLLVAIGIVAALSYLMYGAIKWITSGGDKAAVEAARSHVTHAVIGLLILVLSWVIVSLVMSILGLGVVPTSVILPRLG